MADDLYRRYTGPYFKRWEGFDGAPVDKDRAMELDPVAQQLIQNCFNRIRMNNSPMQHGWYEAEDGSRVDVHVVGGERYPQPVVTTWIRTAERPVPVRRFKTRTESRPQVESFCPALYLFDEQFLLEPNPTLSIPGRVVRTFGSWRLYEKPFYVEPGIYTNGVCTSPVADLHSTKYPLMLYSSDDGETKYLAGFGSAERIKWNDAFDDFDHVWAWYADKDIVAAASGDEENKAYAFVDGEWEEISADTVPALALWQIQDMNYSGTALRHNPGYWSGEWFGLVPSETTFSAAGFVTEEADFDEPTENSTSDILDEIPDNTAIIPPLSPDGTNWTFSGLLACTINSVNITSIFAVPPADAERHNYYTASSSETLGWFFAERVSPVYLTQAEAEEYTYYVYHSRPAAAATLTQAGICVGGEVQFTCNFDYTESIGETTSNFHRYVSSTYMLGETNIAGGSWTVDAHSEYEKKLLGYSGSSFHVPGVTGYIEWFIEQDYALDLRIAARTETLSDSTDIVSVIPFSHAARLFLENRRIATDVSADWELFGFPYGYTLPSREDLFAVTVTEAATLSIGGVNVPSTVINFEDENADEVVVALISPLTVDCSCIFAVGMTIYDPENPFDPSLVDKDSVELWGWYPETEDVQDLHDMFDIVTGLKDKVVAALQADWEHDSFTVPVVALRGRADTGGYVTTTLEEVPLYSITEEV